MTNLPKKKTSKRTSKGAATKQAVVAQPTIVEEYPNWSLAEYFKGVINFVEYALGQSGDFWTKLGGFFMAVLLSLGFIPLSILWFIIKNKGRVGVATWASFPIFLIIGLIWISIA